MPKKALQFFVSALSDVASVRPVGPGSSPKAAVYSVGVRLENNPHEVLEVLDSLQEHVKFQVLSIQVEFLDGVKGSKPPKKNATVSKIVQGDRPHLCFTDCGVYVLDSEDCVVRFNGDFDEDFPCLIQSDCGLYDRNFTTKEHRMIEKELAVLFKDNPGKKYAHIMTGYESDYFKVVFSNKENLESISDVNDARSFTYGVPDFSVPAGGRLIFNLNH